MPIKQGPLLCLGDCLMILLKANQMANTHNKVSSANMYTLCVALCMLVLYISFSCPLALLFELPMGR